ncbi:hypothetical protein CP532_6920 [Ophiocordyceps camponoti-leonardi (nom. inval.)]|nr:hypothetical protein CP532_6920 [Ophiocordyceps camponoti-leonardi (nom. inval.)]
MQLLAVTALLAASLAQAAQGIQNTDAAGYGGGADKNAGPVPENVKKLGKDMARYQGCFMERLWQDAKSIKCGECDKNKKKGEGSLIDCICRNQDMLSHAIRVNENVCLKSAGTSSAIIKEINSDAAGLGISAMCGAYEAGRPREGEHGGSGGYKPEPKPY